MADVSIIQQFLHPPIGFLVREAIAGGPYSGLNAFNRVRGGTLVDAFGIRWLVTFAPPGYGVTPTAGQNQFDRPVVNIAIRHQLFDGEIVVSEEHFYDTPTGQILFQESFPYVVDVELAPGVQAEFWWLLVL